MEALYRCVSGLAAGAAALFAPIGPMASTTAAFIGIDFLTFLENAAQLSDAPLFRRLRRYARRRIGKEAGR